MATGVASLSPVPAQAQGLFDLLGSIFRGVAPRPYRSEPPRLLENFPGEESEEAPPSSGGPHVAYCVRLCDGRYFPLPAKAGAPSMTPAKLCSSLCPAAKTDVFYGSQIDHAASQRGQRYSKLKNAFTYRDRFVDDCTCTGRDTTGVARVDVENDPTLRPGDIVVTAEGPRVFAGNRSTPHKVSEFAPAEDSRRVPKRLRNQLSDMRVAPEYGPANVKSGGQAPRSVGASANPALAIAPGDDAQETETPAEPN